MRVSPSHNSSLPPPSPLPQSDPKYTNCMSLCLFSCQKPKGVDQKSRAECIPPCKSECASSKEQLMIGTPKQ